MPDIERTYQRIVRFDNSRKSYPASPAVVILTLVYLVCALSVPVYQPQRLVWLAAYPLVASETSGIGYGKVLLRSLWILPVVAAIGIFNPIVDTTTAYHAGGITVSRGWLSFISILFRGLLSFQAVIILVETTGFIDIFNSLRKIGCPAVMTTQMLLTYRYISVIIEEAMTMKRAREARGYGRKSYPLKMWGQFIGQLLIRSTRRAANIHRAMQARGFDGTLPTGNRLKWSLGSWIYLTVWCAVIVCLRLFDFSAVIAKMLN